MTQPSEPPSTPPFVHLTAADGSSGEPYRVTSEDVTWLLRAVDAEGPPHDKVAAVLCNGFVWARARKRWRRSLGEWVRAYSQPVNPRWFPDGELHLRELAAHPENAEALTSAATRRMLVHSVRRTFTSSARSAVHAAITGQTKIPPEATDFAAPFVDATKRGYTPLEDATPGRNRLWTRPGAEQWRGYASDATGALLSVWPPWLIVLTLLGLPAAVVLYSRMKGG